MDPIALYLSAIEEYKKSRKLFVDESFEACNDKLGFKIGNKVSAWSRPRPTTVLFKDSTSPMNIKQGVIDDCYLLSAMSVVFSRSCGDGIRNLFLWNDPLFDKDARTKCGAYLVRFW